MALSEEQYNQMSQYFSGQMNPEEESLFFNNIAADEEWHSEFELQKLLRGKQDVYKDLPQILNEVNKEDEQYKKDKERLSKIKKSVETERDKRPVEIPVRKIAYRQWLVAASVLAFVVLCVLSIYYFSKKNNPEIVKQPNRNPIDTLHKNDSQVTQEPNTAYLAYEKFYTPYQPGDNIPVELQNAAVNYKLKKYQVAFDEFSDISEKRGNGYGEQKVIDAYTVFYKGLCLLELKKDSAAYIELSKAYNNQGMLKNVRDDVLWYYALASLKNNRKEQAVSLISNISRTNKTYGDKAEKLLKSIK